MNDITLSRVPPELGTSCSRQRQRSLAGKGTLPWGANNFHAIVIGERGANPLPVSSVQPVNGEGMEADMVRKHEAATLRAASSKTEGFLVSLGTHGPAEGDC